MKGRHPDDETAQGLAEKQRAHNAQAQALQTLAQPVAENQAQDGAAPIAVKQFTQRVISFIRRLWPKRKGERSVSLENGDGKL